MDQRAEQMHSRGYKSRPCTETGLHFVFFSSHVLACVEHFYNKNKGSATAFIVNTACEISDSSTFTFAWVLIVIILELAEMFLFYNFSSAV